VVSDGASSSAPDAVTVTRVNRAPVDAVAAGGVRDADRHLAGAPGARGVDRGEGDAVDAAVAAAGALGAEEHAG
jgi:hypothetical protein